MLCFLTLFTHPVTPLVIVVKCTLLACVVVPPSAPVLYVTSATSSSILLHWKPGDHGNAAVTAYTLNYRRAHADLQELVLSRRTISHELKVRRHRARTVLLYDWL